MKKNVLQTIWVCGILACILTVPFRAYATGPGFGSTSDSSQPSSPALLVIENGPFNSPVRLAPFGRGMLLVTDVHKQAVFVVSKDRPHQIIQSFRVSGSPTGIAAGAGLIYVGNELRGTVEVFSRHGRLLFDFGGEGTVRRPNDIAVSLQGQRVFVVDTAEKVVKVFNPRGRLLNTLGAGILINPTALALDGKAGEVFISDLGDPFADIPPSLHVLDFSGNHLRSIQGSFTRPQGLALSSDRIFLVDSLNGRILVLDRGTGVEVEVIGRYGSDPGSLLLPLDVVLDEDLGKLFVTNNRKGRIEVFLKGGSEP